MIRIETARVTSVTFKTEKAATNRVARDSAWAAGFDTATAQHTVEITSRFDADAQRTLHDVDYVTYRVVEATEVPEGAQGQVSGTRLSPRFGKPIPYGYSARVIALHESGRLKVLNHTGTLVVREDEVFTLLPGTPLLSRVQEGFTVVSDVDEAREEHFTTLSIALHLGVHPLLEKHPLAEVSVLDAAGNVVYDVSVHDSCTKHLIAFSKEINCPDCSNERPCEGCGAESGEPCDPFCTGKAAHEDAQVSTTNALAALLYRDEHGTRSVDGQTTPARGFLSAAEVVAIRTALEVLA